VELEREVVVVDAAFVPEELTVDREEALVRVREYVRIRGNRVVERQVDRGRQVDAGDVVVPLMEPVSREPVVRDVC